MAKHIDREEAIVRIRLARCVGCNSYNGVRCSACGIGDAIDMIEDTPLANVAPVVHGRWVYKHRHRGGIRIYEGKDEMGETRRISVDERYEIDDPYCSECGKLNESVWLNYCPNCGAKMDGGADHEAD